MMKKGRTLLGAAFGINNGLKFGVVIVVDASLMLLAKRLSKIRMRAIQEQRYVFSISFSHFSAVVGGRQQEATATCY